MRKKKSGKNTLLAIIFFILIICAILASVLINVLLVVKSSKFGIGPTFSIFVSNGRQNEIIAFHKDKNSISIVKIGDRVGDIYKFTEVPIEAIYYSANLDFTQPVSEFTSDIFFGITQSKNNLNTLDGFRSFLMAKTVSPKDIREKEIPKSLTEVQRDEIFFSLFQDEKITQEGITIQIINSTQEQGVGNRFARLVSNIGGNVVLVSSGSENINSGVYSSVTSYTSRRLSEALNFPGIKGKIGDISDITIIIGSDYPDLSKY